MTPKKKKKKVCRGGLSNGVRINGSKRAAGESPALDTKKKKKKYVWLCAVPFQGTSAIFSTKEKAKRFCKKHNPTDWDLGMTYGKVEIK